MSYRRKKRAPNKGRKCIRRQRVKMRGNGYVLRCAKYGPKRGAGHTRRKKRGKRRGHRPFNKGRTCVEKGINKLGHETCRSYGKVYDGKKYKNRRKSRPRADSAGDFVREQRAYENKVRRAMYNTPDVVDQDIPRYWVL